MFRRRSHFVVRSKDDYMVILGDHDLANLDPLETTFFIENIIVHPGYNRGKSG